MILEFRWRNRQVNEKTIVKLLKEGLKDCV